MRANKCECDEKKSSAAKSNMRVNWRRTKKKMKYRKKKGMERQQQNDTK